jgi:hypothetical protein
MIFHVSRFSATCFLLFILSFFISSQLSAQDAIIDRTEFYEFLDDFYASLQKAADAGDSTLSDRTNLEIRTRQWNDYLTQTLPKRIKIQIPVDDISLGKETFNRSKAEISYDFKLEMPQKYFQFENNIGSKVFKVNVTEFSKADKNWIRLFPKLSEFEVESDKARKLNVLDEMGYLIFEVTMTITREAGWLHFYQTVFGFESVRWMVDDQLLWELESLPFEEILKRD